MLLFSYARIEVNVSAPIIPFRETIIPPPKVDFLKESLANQQQQFKSANTTKEKPTWILGYFLRKIFKLNLKSFLFVLLQSDF